MNYHNIEKYSTLNGVGIRNILWVSGCPHACKGCHNKQTWNKNSGVPYDKEAHGELMESLSDHFVDGITLSGGECLAPYNIETIYNILVDVKDKHPNMNIWLYSGYLFDDIVLDEKQRKILELCDVLVDGRFELDLMDTSLKWRGSSNQRVIDIKESLKQNKVVLYCE